MTPAQELRAAVKVLRCDHRFPCVPPLGSIANPGACEKCGIHILDVIDVPDVLAEPLTALIDCMARIEEYNAKRGFKSAEQVPLTLAVARAINGGAP